MKHRDYDKWSTRCPACFCEYYFPTKREAVRKDHAMNEPLRRRDRGIARLEKRLALAEGILLHALESLSEDESATWVDRAKLRARLRAYGKLSIVNRKSP